MEKELEELMKRLPQTSYCVRCGHVFPAGPMDEAPYAIEVIENPKTGRRTRGGEICRACYFGGGDEA